MLQTEYVRNLNCNYERILLEKKPEENRYQYCIVTRGGIKGLLPCSLRYINGQAYLYYDISSTQNVMQLYSGKSIGRQWVKDFLWGMRRIRQEMSRFLLDDKNLLWQPHQIFQDLERNDFYFLYVPYCEEEGGFGQLLDFLVEHIDYEDEALVECVYRMHEQFRILGEAYLSEQIYEDGRRLETMDEKAPVNIQSEVISPRIQQETETEDIQSAERDNKENKRGILYFLEGRLKKQRDERENLQQQMGRAMMGYAVSEDTVYTEKPGNSAVKNLQEEENIQELDDIEELGRTMYMEELAEQPAEIDGLYAEDGRCLIRLDKQTTVLGKKRDEADCVIEDASVSRMHARITREKEGLYLEDLNSTNGTFKNGLRLQPYEKRRLDKEDEIRLGKINLIFR